MLTSYFAMMRHFPNDITPIAICAKVPTWYKGKSYKKVAPSFDILMAYKKTGDEETYTKAYNAFLNTLNADEIVNDLKTLSDGKEIVMLCYEKSSDFCHRHLLAKWLKNHGYDCKEWKKEN